MKNIRKRDGRIEEFQIGKITSAIYKALKNTHDDKNETELYELSNLYSNQVVNYLDTFLKYENETPDIEIIQDAVEQILIRNNESATAKHYILYRNDRTKTREMNTSIMNTMKKITFVDSVDVDLKRENANIDGDSAMGTMLRYGSEVSKEFVKSFMLRPEIAKAHSDGDIHIHDMDFYNLTETCVQIDLSALFKNGFSTGHGVLREPNSIISAAALTCIAIQADQNDQHGGQSIPALDFYLAPYVKKTFIKHIERILDTFNIPNINDIIYDIKEYSNNNTSILSNDGLKYITNIINYYGVDNSEYIVKKAVEYTDKDTHQAMEALVHNLNSMQSRAGAQVPFSSINLGTDTSEEGRMVTKNLLIATDEGLGNGETPIFPISIFKLKSGVSYNKEDPNYDLFKLACKVSAKRLFPNFSNLDAPFNSMFYKEGDINTEVSYMGCRTRVLANNYDKTRQIVTGRGNVSFTSINLPRIAIESNGNIKTFIDLLDEKMELVFTQLLDRLKVQGEKKVKNYPFLMGQGIWIDSNKLSNEDKVGEIIKHGSLTTGFIGLAECLVALIGEHHGQSKEAQELGLMIIEYMRNKCDKKSEETGLNFTLIATPAEGLSGRFINLDKKKYGIIKGVTDREYYTNSMHIPVYYPISAYDKIRLEAPYHNLTNGGHITYVEVDGDPLKNLDAFEDLVRMAHDMNIGYFSINHPVDRDCVCGYTGIIDDVCPRCGRHDGEEISLDKLKELQKMYKDIHIPYTEELETNDIIANIDM